MPKWNYSVNISQALNTSLKSRTVSPPITFIKYRRNILFLVSFIWTVEFYNLPAGIYENWILVLPLVTSHIAHLFNQFNYVFALLISMARFKCINFYQNRPIIKLLLQKIQIFWPLGAPLPDLRNSPSVADFWLCVCVEIIHYYAIYFAVINKCESNYAGTVFVISTAFLGAGPWTFV